MDGLARGNDPCRIIENPFDGWYRKGYYKIMNAKHRKTLAAIMGTPLPKTLAFRDVESLLLGLGCKVKEHEGSRVVFIKDSTPWTTHRPHPDKTTRDYQIRQLRVFLKEIGVVS